MARTSYRWRGDEVQARFNRAAARGLIAIAENVAVETKRVTHIQEGTLRRSVHAAPVGYNGAADEVTAKTTDMQGLINLAAVMASIAPALEVGSWLPYACAEWVGRSHPGVTQGLETVRGKRAEGIMVQAFAEEGLR